MLLEPEHANEAVGCAQDLPRSTMAVLSWWSGWISSSAAMALTRDSVRSPGVSPLPLLLLLYGPRYQSISAFNSLPEPKLGYRDIKQCPFLQMALYSIIEITILEKAFRPTKKD
jgi:hypothetical protein